MLQRQVFTDVLTEITLSLPLYKPFCESLVAIALGFDARSETLQKHMYSLLQPPANYEA